MSAKDETFEEQRMNYKIVTENNDLILSESLHELIAMYVLGKQGMEFELFLANEGLEIICERKPKNIPELNITFEDV
jgi:hypothetical protein